MSVASTTSASVAVTPWDSARRSARRARARLLARVAEAAENEADGLTRADRLLDLGLRDARLTLRLLPPDDSLLSGAHAVLDREASAVWVRADALPTVRAVYTAHELAHFHLHAGGEGGDRRCCEEPDFADMDGTTAMVGYGPRQRRETEANVWAREFLLPTDVAERAFLGEGIEAREIATRVGVPVNVVFTQLGESLGGAVTLPPAAEEEENGGSGEAKPAFPLDPSQAAAAYATTGPLLVGAGPGTGKTRTLTERVLFLTRQQAVAPENLLALTFSRKAAEEMRVRIAQQDPEVGRRTAISTFHAYGRDLLRRHGAAAGLPASPILLDSVDACALLEREAASLGLTALRYLHDPAYPLPDILRTISRAKEDLIAPDEFERRARATNDEKLIDVARVYHVYEKLLRDKGALDFADLICRALHLLQDDALVRAAEQAQWQHVLVDEYQDVNRAGALLVKALSGRDDNVGLWAVGDLRQAIYRFRGASPANITRFPVDFPNGRRTELTVNYRSQPALVRLFGEASGDGPDMWQASRKQEAVASATLALAEEEGRQIDGMARRMREFSEDGIGFGDQVVLCRTRGQARGLRTALTRRGIPVAASQEEKNPLASKDVRSLLALVSRACEKNTPARYRWEQLPPALYAVRNRADCDAYDLLTEALWGAPGLARTVTDRSAVATLLGLARGFRDRATILRDPDEDAASAFLDHLRRMVRLGASLAGDREEAETDAVRILTVHASKGLEFPVVFVPNLSAGKFPTRAAPALIAPLPEMDDALDDDSPYAEEERLFFVALTRARDYLILSRALKYNGRSCAKSPLLTLVESAKEWKKEGWLDAYQAVPAESSSSVEAGLAPTPGPSPVPGEGSSLSGASSAKGSIPGLPDSPLPERERGRGWGQAPLDEGDSGQEGVEPPTLPASDAELYLRCPRRYYYSRVLDLPEGANTPYNGFKRAVTAALEDVNPADALDGVWEEHGPESDHPHTALYRQAAEEIVGQKGAALGPASTPPEEMELPLRHGTITVRPEAVVAEGAVFECRTFRKPPAPNDTTDLAADRRLSLLQAVAEASGGSTGAVQMRYLQNGTVRTVADRPKVRAKHLDEYDSALRGIGDEFFDPAPTEVGECPTCPYFFICPD